MHSIYAHYSWIDPLIWIDNAAATIHLLLSVFRIATKPSSQYHSLFHLLEVHSIIFIFNCNCQMWHSKTGYIVVMCVDTGHPRSLFDDKCAILRASRIFRSTISLLPSMLINVNQILFMTMSTILYRKASEKAAQLIIIMDIVRISIEKYSAVIFISIKPLNDLNSPAQHKLPFPVYINYWKRKEILPCIWSQFEIGTLKEA